MNGEDSRRLDDLVAELRRAVERAPGGVTVVLAVRLDRAKHICRSSEVREPKRPLVVKSR